MSRRGPERTSSRAARARSFFVSFLRRAVVALALVYPGALLLVILLLTGIGESHWVTTLGLYVPRIVFAAPLPILVVLLVLFRRYALLWTQLVALVLVSFPLMGFVFPWFSARDDDARSVRVLTLNASSGQFGYDEIVAAVTEVAPDVALFQEAAGHPESFLESLRTRYPHVEGSKEFVVASRFPIVETTEPPKLDYLDRQRSPRFMRYVIETPLGALALYSVHPVSPRGVLKLHRFRGTFSRLRSGDLFEGDPAADVGANTGLRAVQARAISAMASRETLPVVIAGDTNLPDLSKVLRQNLSSYDDGFRSAGAGFGYTFPAKYPWLRLDRIFVSSVLRVVSFDVGCVGVSDHLCAYAEIQRH